MSDPPPRVERALTPVAERARRSREQRHFARALEAAALAHELPRDALAGELAKLGPGSLEELKWRLASVTRNVSHGRRDFDAYFTPPAVASAVTRRVAELVPRPRSILEPSAGLGAFVRAAIDRWIVPPITAVDIKVRRQLRALQPRAGVVHMDFLRYPATLPRYELILGNPPFRDAEAHILHALELLAPGGHLAFLLRLGFLASVERAQGLWARPGLLHVAPIVPRPAFISTGTDLSEYALFVWRRGYAGGVELGRPVLWRDAGAKRGAA